MGDHKEQAEIQALYQAENKAQLLAREQSAKQKYWYVQQRVVEKRRLRRQEVIAVAAIQQRVSVIPVIIPQIPISVLAQLQRGNAAKQRSQHQK